MGRERRRHSRVRAKGVAAHVRGLDRSFICVVEDLSEGGLFLRTDQLLPRGTFVVIDLVRPGQRKVLRLEGTVAGAKLPGPDNKPGMGIEFGEIPDGERARLLALLSELGAPAAPQQIALEPDGEAPIVLTEIAPGAREPHRPPRPRPAAVPLSTPAVAIDPSRLMLQIQGLLVQLEEARCQLQLRDAELESLRSQLSARDS